MLCSALHANCYSRRSIRHFDISTRRRLDVDSTVLLDFISSSFSLFFLSSCLKPLFSFLLLFISFSSSTSYIFIGNWPYYNGGYIGNTDRRYNRTWDRHYKEQPTPACVFVGNQDASCPYLQRAVRDNILFQTPGIHATLVVFDYTSSGPNPIYRKEYLDGYNNCIPISIISLSPNQRTNGRNNRHHRNNSRRDNNSALLLNDPNDPPVINATTTTTVTVTDATGVENENEIMVPDMGLVPRGVNTVELSSKEIQNIDDCQDDFYVKITVQYYLVLLEIFVIQHDKSLLQLQ